MNTNPKFAIFAFDKFYPDGGCNDLYYTTYTLQESVQIAKEAVTTGSKKQRYDSYEDQPTKRPYYYAQVLCLTTCKVVLNIDKYWTNTDIDSQVFSYCISDQY